MLSDFDNYQQHHFKKLKKRTRKGVPDPIRGFIWQKMTGISKYLNNETLKDTFQNLIKDEDSDIQIESVILNDIYRTYPKHIFFKEKFGEG